MAAKKKDSIWLHVKGVIAVTIIGSAIAFSMMPVDNYSWEGFYISLAYCFMIGTSLWVGNYSINPGLEYLFRKNPLNPGKKLVFSLLSMIIFSTVIILFVNWLWIVVLWKEDFNAYITHSGRMIMIIEMVVVIIIALVLFTSEFFHSWREAVKNEEALKSEKLALQYEALKNQVNPHFLFNSLNTLSGLIGKDAQKATKFVKQLSDIYRYVLEHKDRELVQLDTEMKFVENYISLMKIRFGDNLVVKSNVVAGSIHKVIPLSIQMLVENAIKHNIISSEMPLAISISREDDNSLLITNNLQKKTSILQDGSGEWEKHGLLNIKSRYEYLGKGVFVVNGSTQEPFPEELDGNFAVSVPLIS